MNDKTVLCTFDVKSLHTNIPHEYGLEAMNYWLDKYQDSINPRFLEAFKLHLWNLSSKNTTFKFNDGYFLQLVGKARGTDMAPTYATLTIAYHELKFYMISQIHWGVEVREYIEQAWSHVPDDCEIPIC